METSIRNEIQREHRMRFIEILISIIFGIIALGIFLVVPISAILLGKNIQQLNHININMAQGFDQARKAISLLNQAKNNITRLLDFGIATAIPFVAIYLIIRIGANGLLFSNEYFYYHRISQNKKLFNVCLSKRIVNICMICVVLITWCILLTKIKNEFYHPTHIILTKINDVFQYIVANDGSIDHMQLEWYNAHAEELQKLFINISNTYKEEVAVINTTLYNGYTIPVYIALTVIFFIGLIGWLISASVFGALTKSIIIGNEPEDIIWLLNNQKIILDKKVLEKNAPK